MQKELMESLSDMLIKVEWACEQSKINPCRCNADFKCSYCNAREVLNKAKYELSNVESKSLNPIKRVRCITTGQEFDTMTEASVITGVPQPNISKVCNGNGNYAGTILIGDKEVKLKWEFIQE